MKLELKHLAPYLPYNTGINIIFTNGYVAYSNVLNAGWLLKFIRDEIDIRPLLRPLSDLTKKIEHNGEKFEPIEYLYNNYTPITKSVKGMYMDLQSPLDHRFDVVQKLIEWHFDVFGLIDAGLAVEK